MQPDPSGPVLVRDLRCEELAAAVAITARAMRDNPINVRVLGGSPRMRVKALTRLFRAGLGRTMHKGVLLGAFRAGELAGVAGLLRPGCCQLLPAETLATLPALLTSIQLPAIVRMSRWLSDWKAQDLHEAHWHLGPVAVEPGLQGQGVGAALLIEACARIDRVGLAGYLETDKAANVGFYERFGFQTVAEADVLGVANWFMQRPGSAPPAISEDERTSLA